MASGVEKWGLDPSSLPARVAASREPIIRLFSYHDAHPIALVMALMEKFSTDWVEWEGDTLHEEIVHTFNASSVSEHNWQKIQATRTLMRTVGFWEEWHIFEKIIQSLNNNVPQFDITQRCSLSQLMAGVDIANQIREEQFKDEPKKYVAACALDAGVVYLPPPLDFAQRPLSQPMYRCKICGNIDTDDLDGRCDFCSGRFSDERPLNFKPNPKLPKDSGSQVEKFLERDPTSTQRRFDLLKVKRDATLSDESREDVQAAKLMVAYDYMLLRRRQLVEQLEELKSWVTH